MASSDDAWQPLLKKYGIKPRTGSGVLAKKRKRMEQLQTHYRESAWNATAPGSGLADIEQRGVSTGSKIITKAGGPVITALNTLMVPQNTAVWAASNIGAAADRAGNWTYEKLTGDKARNKPMDWYPVKSIWAGSDDAAGATRLAVLAAGGTADQAPTGKQRIAGILGDVGLALGNPAARGTAWVAPARGSARFMTEATYIAKTAERAAREGAKKEGKLRKAIGGLRSDPVIREQVKSTPKPPALGPQTLRGRIGDRLRTPDEVLDAKYDDMGWTRPARTDSLDDLRAAKKNNTKLDDDLGFVGGVKEHQKRAFRAGVISKKRPAGSQLGWKIGYGDNAAVVNLGPPIPRFLVRTSTSKLNSRLLRSGVETGLRNALNVSESASHDLAVRAQKLSEKYGEDLSERIGKVLQTEDAYGGIELGKKMRQQLGWEGKWNHEIDQLANDAQALNRRMLLEDEPLLKMVANREAKTTRTIDELTDIIEKGHKATIKLKKNGKGRSVFGAEVAKLRGQAQRINQRYRDIAEFQRIAQMRPGTDETAQAVANAANKKAAIAARRHGEIMARIGQIQTEAKRELARQQDKLNRKYSMRAQTRDVQKTMFEERGELVDEGALFERYTSSVIDPLARQVAKKRKYESGIFESMTEKEALDFFGEVLSPAGAQQMVKELKAKGHTMAEQPRKHRIQGTTTKIELDWETNVFRLLANRSRAHFFRMADQALSEMGEELGMGAGQLARLREGAFTPRGLGFLGVRGRKVLRTLMWPKAIITVGNYPAHMLRNLYGSWRNAWIDGDIRHVMPYLPFPKYDKWLRSVKQHPDEMNRVYDLGDGVTMTGEEMAHLWALSGLSRGFALEDLGLFMQGFEQSRNPAKRYLAWASKKNINAENAMRMRTWFLHMRAGDDPMTAAMKTTRVLFDYGDLTNWEKRWARNLVFFYTWTRKNLPLQFQALFTNPSPMIAAYSVARGAESGSEDTPAYWQRAMKLPTPWGAMAYGDPLGDLTKIDFGDVEGTGRQQLAGVNPLAKVPLEVITNQNFFTGGKIERSPGARRPSELAAGLAALGIPMPTGRDRFDEPARPALWDIPGFPRGSAGLDHAVSNIAGPQLGIVGLLTDETTTRAQRMAALARYGGGFSSPDRSRWPDNAWREEIRKLAEETRTRGLNGP